MTPVQLNEYARMRYNAVSDTFWSDDEIYKYMYDACIEMARECLNIERIYSTTTVAGTQSYDFPTNTMEIKRVTWGGRKLIPMDMRDDDAFTGMNQDTTDQGTPEAYWQYNNAIYLRPIPGSADTLKIWTHNYPSSISSTSTLEIPEMHHMKLANYINQMMALKDQNINLAQYYFNLWEKDKLDVKKFMRKMKRADGFATVKDENMVVETYIV